MFLLVLIGHIPTLTRSSAVTMGPHSATTMTCVDLFKLVNNYSTLHFNGHFPREPGLEEEEDFTWTLKKSVAWQLIPL